MGTAASVPSDVTGSSSSKSSSSSEVATSTDADKKSLPSPDDLKPPELSATKKRRVLDNVGDQGILLIGISLNAALFLATLAIALAALFVALGKK
jgi:hypothetical protein